MIKEVDELLENASIWTSSPRNYYPEKSKKIDQFWTFSDRYGVIQNLSNLNSTNINQKILKEEINERENRKDIKPTTGNQGEIVWTTIESLASKSVKDIKIKN